MAQFNIQLSEDEIERLINGQAISIPANFKNGKTHIKKINIMQSIVKDMTLPLVIRENKVVSQTENENMRLGTEAMGRKMAQGNGMGLGI